MRSCIFRAKTTENGGETERNWKTLFTRYKWNHHFFYEIATYETIHVNSNRKVSKERRRRVIIDANSSDRVRVSLILYL